MNGKRWIVGLVIACLCSWQGPSCPASVVINEFLTSNSIPDAGGLSPDWIELYNSGPDSISLSGYGLTDDKDEPFKWVFPAVTLPAGGFLLIYATGQDQRDPAKPLHTNFKLAREGEYLALRNRSGVLLDEYDPFEEQQTDVSYGRYPDGSEFFRYFTAPTPGVSNQSSGGTMAAPPDFSPPAGIYSTPVTVTLSTGEPDSEIRYSLDGSIPSPTSPLFLNSLSFSEPAVVRARVFRPGFEPSPVVTHSYLIGADLSLPIFSLVTAPENLWDAGTGLMANPEEQGDEWERPVSIEYFERTPDRTFVENAGLRVHGNASRRRSSKHSFRFYFRSDYGSAKLEYPIFPDVNRDRFDQLVLRTSFQDSWNFDYEEQRQTATYITDQTVRALSLDMGSVTPHGTFVRMYLNGQYWGLYNLTERIREDFLEDYFGDSDWDMIEYGGPKLGDRVAWDEFRSFFFNHDLSDPVHYQTLQTMLDLKNFTHYLILNCWVQNVDWPGFNYTAVRERLPGAKWKFVVWDADACLGTTIKAEGYHYDYKILTRMVESGYGPVSHLTRALLPNPEFRQSLWQEYLTLQNTVLSEEHVLQRFEEYADTVRPAIADEAIRWATDKNIDDWEYALELGRLFIQMRPSIMTEDFTETLGPPPNTILDACWQLY